jgi:Protein of unknown function (DUF3800)
MSNTLNIYCDESCHLLNDGHEVMTLGALWCPLERRREASVRLREIKAKHGIPPTTEVKWTKVSPAKVEFYCDWLDFFFDDDDLHFRAVVIPQKSALRHDDFGHTHDDWYYKMLFTLVSPLLKPEDRHRIYLDHKDTHSGAKATKLHEVLCSSAYDFNRAIIERVQPVVSHESELMQLCDLLIGAVGYANRNLGGSSAKMRLVARMRQRSGLSLTRSTLLNATKVNLLHWEGGRNRP